MQFIPFVLGHHGGFGESAKELWGIFARRAKEVRGRDWRHSWSARSFTSVWLQKLSIVLARETGFGALARTSVRSRQVVLGEGLFAHNGERESVSVAEGRSAAGVER